MIAAVLFCLAQASASPGSPPAPSPSPRPTPSGPVVVLDTSAGRIRIGLYEDKSPKSVENFLHYVRKGQFDGTIFHRVIPGFMIQGGGMTPDLKEKPTDPPIRNEARNGVRNSRGTIAMARTNDPDSATAQFFINLKDNAFLDFGIRGAGYAVFGEVLEGMDVVDKIATMPTTTRAGNENVPVTAVVIRTARVEGGTRPASAKPAAASPAPPVRRPTRTVTPQAPSRPRPATPHPSASPQS
jgi:peptidyl-prolyl cis-trans isomerase A (cyclophilin A)